MVDHTGYSLHLKNRHHHVLPGSSAKAAGSTGECECVRGKGVVTFYIYILHLGHLADAFRFFRFTFFFFFTICQKKEKQQGETSS